jgi:hypothetical protein
MLSTLSILTRLFSQALIYSVWHATLVIINIFPWTMLNPSSVYNFYPSVYNSVCCKFISCGWNLHTKSFFDKIYSNLEWQMSTLMFFILSSSTGLGIYAYNDFGLRCVNIVSNILFYSTIGNGNYHSPHFLFKKLVLKTNFIVRSLNTYELSCCECGSLLIYSRESEIKVRNYELQLTTVRFFILQLQ